jgi:hypothetical protein
MKKTLIIILVIIYCALHLTPESALKTHIFLTGHFSKAISTDVIEDVEHNEMDKDDLIKENAKCYRLTDPPIEKATQGELRNYKVRKIGFIYFAKYYGEG